MKKYYFLFLLSITGICQSVYAQGGDNCAAALASPITVPTVLTGQTTNGYTNTYSGIAGTTPGTFYQNEPDRLYAFIPSCSGNISITMNVTSACGGWTTYGAIYLFQNCPNVGTHITSATSSTNPVTITGPVIAGNTYYIWVDSWTCGATGWINYDLNISFSGGPSFSSPTSDNGYWISYASGGTNYNSYASVISIPNSTTLEVDDIAGFSPCDYVMIIQMKGASVNLTSTPAYGSVTNLNLAGRYEFNRIKHINASCTYEFWLENPLSLSFNRDNIIQVIRVPYVTDLVLNTNYTVPPFDGRKGGIMVLYGQNSITFNNANIDVQGRGYRGGNSIGSAWGCGGVPIPPPYFLSGPAQDFAGAKGESFASFPAGHELARGAMANAGGAGLNVNAGGAGASNGGTGGTGGGDWISCSPRNDGLGGGIPGYTVAATATRILMGGGGGSGHAGNNVVDGGDGGSGGGAVWIFTNNLVVNGTNTINAAGANATNISGQWAGGGGGAGGTVQITSASIAGGGTLNVNTSGGNGGNAYWPNELGPGGGGGGGRLILSYASLPAQIAHNSTGGTLGVFCGPCTNPYYNTAGTSGAVTNSLTIPTPPFPLPCTPLPVQNLVLSGKAEANRHVLQWQTDNIATAKRFEVEISDGDKPFTYLASVDATRSSVYEYTHTPDREKTMYRIKQMDKDGKTTYSNVLTLHSSDILPYLTMSGSLVSVRNYTQSVEVYTLQGQLLVRYEQNPAFIDVSLFNTTAPLILRIQDKHWMVKP